MLGWSGAVLGITHHDGMHAMAESDSAHCNDSQRGAKTIVHIECTSMYKLYIKCVKTCFANLLGWHADAESARKDKP